MKFMSTSEFFSKKHQNPDGSEIIDLDFVRNLTADLELAQKTTLGPWFALRESDDNGLGEPLTRMENDAEIVVGRGTDMCLSMPAENDALFIAESRRGWPAAIRLAIHYRGRAEAAETEVQRLQSELERITRGMP